MRLFQAALDTPLDSLFSGPASQVTVCTLHGLRAFEQLRTTNYRARSSHIT